MTNKNISNILIVAVVLSIIIWPTIQNKFKKSSPSAVQSTIFVSPSPAVNQVLGTQIGNRTKTSDCHINGKLHDQLCTPGAILADATVDKICVPGYTKTVRNVPGQLKNEVFAEYGIASHNPGEYEVDHLISLELGGSNDIANLWPQPAEPRPGFHEKDKVENYLHQQVCNGAMKLDQAQKIISTDWTQLLNAAAQ